MAANCFRDFFPTLWDMSAAIPLISQFLNFIFPDCAPAVPSLHFKVFGAPIDVNWPWVAVAASAGFLLFLDAGTCLICLSQLKRQYFRSGRRFSNSWTLAMLFYSLMCFGGLFYHSFGNHHFFYCLDVIGTSCSGISIVAACLELDDRNPIIRRTLLSCYSSAVIATFIGSPLTRELIYVLPTIGAFLSCLYFVPKNILELMIGAPPEEEEEEETKRKTAEKKIKIKIKNGTYNPDHQMKKMERESMGIWILVCLVGAVLSVGGVAGNRWVTRVVGPDFNVCFFFFLGCDIGLWALYKMAVISNALTSLI